MIKQKSAAAAGAVATGPVPRPPVLEHTTAELVSLIANLSEREGSLLPQAGSQPELGANPVSLRPPIRPKGGPMGLLDIPGPNSAQKSGGKGWNPANGVPFCARAYICRPRPWGWLGGFWMQGSTPDALSTIRCGGPPPSQPMRSEKRYPSGTLPNQAFRASPAPRGHRPPSGGKFELLPPPSGKKVFSGLLSAS